jgi:hypothetical protein
MRIAGCVACKSRLSNSQQQQGGSAKLTQDYIQFMREAQHLGARLQGSERAGAKATADRLASAQEASMLDPVPARFLP